MRGPIFLLAVPLLIASGAVQAQEPDLSAVRGIKVVIPDARARRASYGTRKLTRALRSQMKKGTGTLVSAKSLKKAQKKLKLRGSAARQNENLARAGKKAGAQYVLAVTITKKKWLYTARALLINSETGEQQMDFRSEFYKPGREAADRGRRIGKRTLLKIATLLEEGDAPNIGGGAVAVVTPPPSDGFGRLEEDPDPSDLVEDPPPPSGGFGKLEEDPTPNVGGDPDEGSTTASNDFGTSAGMGTGTSDTGSGGTSDFGSSGSSSFDSGSSSSSGGGVFASGNSSSIETPRPTRKESASEFLRVSLQGGAGLLHSYSIDSADLSYTLSPTALFKIDSELVIPSLNVGIDVDVAFRPVRYEVGYNGDTVEEPTGSMLDFTGALTYHLGLSGKGLNQVKVIPKLGARLNSTSVGAHPGNVVLAASILSAIAGAELRLPVNETLELDFGLDGGLILSYSESPQASGTSSSGFTVGGDVGARIWLSRAIAVAIDNRFTLNSVSFEGTPSRQISGGQVALNNLSLSRQDLRTSIGIAARF